MPTAEQLLDLAPVTAERFDRLSRRVGQLLGTSVDVALVGAEATWALEAAARSLGRPGSVALNVVTGPYGALFGSWLADAGSRVVEVRTADDRAVGLDEVARALRRHPEIGLVCLVHAEAATGTVNPLLEVAQLAVEHGALAVVDAVASVGAEPLAVDRWGVDVCVVGPQKALAGPVGVSAVSVSPKAWDWMTDHPAPRRRSALSLLDWKVQWFDTGRQVLPFPVDPLELAALEAAVARVEAESMAATVGRHRAAAVACRAGLQALHLVPWVARAHEATGVVTTLAPPHPAPEVPALGPALVAPGPGALATRLWRVNHTGQAARLEAVLEALELLAGSPGRRLEDAWAAATSAWAAAERPLTPSPS